MKILTVTDSCMVTIQERRGFHARACAKAVHVPQYETISDKLTNFDIAKKNAGENAGKIPEYPSDHFPIAVTAAIK